MRNYNVPKSHVATIITHLEMHEHAVLSVPDCKLSLERWTNPTVEDYCALFRKVGEPWMWISRLLMDEDELETILHDPAVEVSMVRDGEQSIGFIELDFREPATCEIAFFGLIPECNGKGYGRWMMKQALQRAWRDGIERVWLHTCTQDSPRALPFYQQCGFRIFKQEIDMMEDPRLSGHLLKTAAPHVPIFS
ncbi:GNAT family N-acetyltransferase [Parasphingorhabdus sp.]|uniref:GNAT family N-acetyltransferase n=1 Tax=Parasphingorhabdus sp. TaxID=2709688 RepID=UPI0032663414